MDADEYSIRIAIIIHILRIFLLFASIVYIAEERDRDGTRMAHIQPEKPLIDILIWVLGCCICCVCFVVNNQRANERKGKWAKSMPRLEEKTYVVTVSSVYTSTWAHHINIYRFGRYLYSAHNIATAHACVCVYAFVRSFVRFHTFRNIAISAAQIHTKWV